MRRALAAAALLAQAACVAAPPPAASPAPPAPRPAAARADEVAAPDPTLVRLYAAQERRLRAQGLLKRSDAGVAFGADELARAFVQVALFDEYREGPRDLVQQATRSNLRRWDQPVRIGVTFGASVPPARQARDRADIARYAARLSRATGHPVALTDGTGANFHVLVLSEDERRTAAPLIRGLIPRVSDASIRAATNLPVSIYCLALAFSEPGNFTYSGALAIVRAEHPDLTRLSCYHEEIAQGLGLANDDPAARPSIFNDDEEFALLTRLDELMLRMLYDPRLSPGMTPAEAAPIAARIARELLPESGS